MKEFLVKNRKNIAIIAIAILLIVCIGITMIYSTGLDGSAFAYTAYSGTEFTLSYNTSYNSLYFNSGSLSDLITWYNANDVYDPSSSLSYDACISLSGHVVSEDNYSESTVSGWTTGEIENNGACILKLYTNHETNNLFSSYGSTTKNEFGSTSSIYIKDYLKDYIISSYGVDASTVGSYYFVLCLAYDYDLRGCQALSSNTFGIWVDVTADDMGLLAYPTAPIITGYDFVGWYYDADFTDPYVSGSTFEADTNLYAKYTESIYTYTVYAFNSSVYSGTCTYSDEFVIFDNYDIPVIANYVFVGAYKGTTTTTEYDTSTVVTSDTIVTLKYDVITYYTVSFYVNGTLYNQLQVAIGGWLSDDTVLVEDDSYGDITVSNLYPLYLDEDLTEVVEVVSEPVYGNIHYFSAGLIENEDETGDETGDEEGEEEPDYTEVLSFLEEYKVLLGVLGGLILLSITYGIVSSIVNKNKRSK